MVEATLAPPTQQMKGYGELRKAVSKTLIQGQLQLEELKVRIYWKTGRLIDAYLTGHPEAGMGVLERLSKDLEMERSLFYRLLQFARTFSDVAARRRLTWVHYRELLSVTDPVRRETLARLAHNERWSSRRLIVEIKRRTKKEKLILKQGEPAKLQEPPRGNLGIRRVGWLNALASERVKVIDLGFEIYSPLPEAQARVLEEKQFVRFSEKKGRWLPDGEAKDLYYYKARVERVVDGDTLLVQIDFGGTLVKRQYLRLRGINTPELGSVQGKKAKDFVINQIGKSKTLTFKSRSRDAYDRWLSDVWADDIYLNQLLLDKGFAERAY